MIEDIQRQPIHSDARLRETLDEIIIVSNSGDGTDTVI